MDDSTNKDFDDLDRLLEVEIQTQKEASAHKQAEKSAKPKVSENGRPKSEPKRRPRKPQMKLKLPDIDLDAITPVISRSSSVSQIPTFSHQASSTLITDIEKSVTNYLDNRLSEIKTEFCSNLRFLLEKEEDFDSIINNFTSDLLDDVSREIKFNVSSPGMPMIPINVGINLPRQQNKYKSMINSITEFKARNTSLNESMKTSYNDFKSSVHRRNKSFKNKMQREENMKAKLRHVKKAGYKCEMKISMIDASINAMKNSEENYSKMTSELEASRINREAEFISTSKLLGELSSLLPELNQNIAEPYIFNDFSTSFEDEIRDIKRRRNSIEIAMQDLCTSYINACNSKKLTQSDIYRSTMSYLPTEEPASLTRNRLSIMNSNQVNTLSPQKKSTREIRVNQDFSTHGKFTLPLVSYVY